MRHIEVPTIMPPEPPPEVPLGQWREVQWNLVAQILCAYSAQEVARPGLASGGDAPLRGGVLPSFVMLNEIAHQHKLH